MSLFPPRSQPSSPSSPVPEFSAFASSFAFVALYVLFDWATYIDPLYGLNITPWSPDPSLGLVFWLIYGWRAAVPWFVALCAGEMLVRGMPAGLPLTLLLSLWLTIGYGLIGMALRRQFGDGAVFDNRGRLLRWLAIVAVGTLFNGMVYMTLLSAAGLIPAGQWTAVVLRYGIGDMTGVVVSMPLIWMLAGARGRERLRDGVWRAETAGYLALTFGVLYLVFGTIATSGFNHFYFLFLPVIWAASRQGLSGAALMVFVLQAGIVALVKWNNAVDIAVPELQMLNAVLALAGFSIGIVVDELRQVAAGLKRSLRLAAAGEMAAALAHELNQPLTALGAYGKACELLLERGGGAGRGDAGSDGSDGSDGRVGGAGGAGSDEALLKTAIGRMIAEAGRAAEVVRRLRDFFRTGAMHLEPVEARHLVAAIGRQFFPQLREHGVTLTVSEIPPLALMADRLQIELVLRNLLANALEAVQERPAGTRTITLSAQLLPSGPRGAAASGACLQLSVEDSGAGVSEALAPRLFEPFVSSKASGLGLGLVLSRAIVEAHGGALWVEVGARGIFRVALPLAPAPAPAPARETHHAP